MRSERHIGSHYPPAAGTHSVAVYAESRKLHGSPPPGYRGKPPRQEGATWRRPRRREVADGAAVVAEDVMAVRGESCLWNKWHGTLEGMPPGLPVSNFRLPRKNGRRPFGIEHLMREAAAEER
ncbi:hypothetical protein MTO96_006700 [Rhipicephalus appendiculatus]